MDPFLEGFLTWMFLRWLLIGIREKRQLADLRNQLNEKHAEAEEYYGRMVEAEQLKEDAA